MNPRKRLRNAAGGRPACAARVMRVPALLAVPILLQGGEPAFRAHVIESDLRSGYQVLATDIDGDARPDVVGLSSRADTLFWYRNPGWERRAIASGMQGMICLDAADLDGDGTVEIALGAGFGVTDATSEGRVYILRSAGDVAQPWEAREIDRLPTTHRLQFLDFDGDGVQELLNSPLTGPGCRGPLFACATPIAYYEPGEWARRYLTADLDGVVHGMRAVQWDGPAVVAASMGGVDRFRPDPEGGWIRAHIADGALAERPRDGASEVAVGRSPEGRFVATIEPWHGSDVAVYCCEGRGYLDRTVIDTTLRDGHVLLALDIDGDGEDEVLAGMRGEPYRLAFYRRGPDGWTRSVIDEGGLAAAGCDTADLDGDGDTDVVCIGARTGNIKWYENLGGSAAR